MDKSKSALAGQSPGVRPKAKICLVSGVWPPANDESRVDFELRLWETIVRQEPDASAALANPWSFRFAHIPSEGAVLMAETRRIAMHSWKDPKVPLAVRLAAFFHARGS